MEKLFDPKDLKRGDKVLWLHDGEVESGDVLFLSENTVDVCWLEGYKSRNDAPTFGEILAVHRKDGEIIKLGAFSGNSFLTQAGAAYLAQEYSDPNGTQSCPT